MTRESVNGPVRRLLVLGSGYSGRRIAARAAEAGFAVCLTRRSPATDPVAAPEPADDLPWLLFDGATGVRPSDAELAGTTHLLSTIPPDALGQDPVLQQLRPQLEALPLEWVGYLSTTGVYGDCGGAWVDEESPTRPQQPRSQARLDCEHAWRATGLPVQVLRLPAIYGPGRMPFASLLDGTARLIHKPGQVFSRVHVDDIAGAVLHLLSLPAVRRPPTVILADACPCPSSETLSYAAHLLGCRLPEMQSFASLAASMSPMAQSFWSENRRADSRLLRDTLGYALRFPSFREGYRAFLGESNMF